MNWTVVFFVLCTFVGITFAERAATLEVCKMNLKVIEINFQEKVRNLQESMLKRPVINLNLEKWKTYIQVFNRFYKNMIKFSLHLAITR